MDSIEKIKQRYYDIIPRSFSTKLELYLFSQCHTKRNIGIFALWELMHFKITDKLVDVYLLALTLGDEERINDAGLTMNEIDVMIESWEKRIPFLGLSYMKLTGYILLLTSSHFPILRGSMIGTLKKESVTIAISMIKKLKC